MMKIIISAVGASIFFSVPVLAQQLWCWSFTGTGVFAAGTFVTGPSVDAEGFYPITAITGNANSATVTALQPTDTSIPGNSGYPVDNVVRMAAPQLTKHGLGFVTSDGTYHNAFHVDQYRDYVSRPPYADGKGAEPTIQFKAITTSGSRCPAQ
ncbi:MAG TPA: hypothetical protein VL614_27315 [Acetobacteraceae bacterium]|jgi:hypothetical protein|nr:hypothetical protein [Acetobacteraceae bacterium]